MIYGSKIVFDGDKKTEILNGRKNQLDKLALEMEKLLPNCGIKLKTFDIFEKISIEEAKELQKKIGLEKAEYLFQCKAKTFELLYSLNKSIKNDDNAYKNIANFDSYVHTIVNTLYDKEIRDEIKETLKNNYKNELEKKEIDEIELNQKVTDIYSQYNATYKDEIDTVKKTHLNSLGFSNTNETIENAKKEAGKKTSLENKLIQNINDYTKFKGSDYSVEKICNDYKALEEKLNKKNPIARFFSFSAKKALKDCRNKIAEENNLKDRKEIDKYINKNAKFAYPELMNKNTLNYSLTVDALKELQTITAKDDIELQKNKEISKRMSPGMEILNNKKDNVEQIEIEMQDLSTMENTEKINKDDLMINTNVVQSDEIVQEQQI